MTRRVLVPVDNYADESGIVAGLARLRAHLCCPVAPIIDRNGLPGRLRSVLAANGLVVTLQAAPARLAAAPFDDGGPHVSGPGLIISSEGVDPGLAALAGALCRSATRELP